MKTEVYSWRVSASLKTGLDQEARRRKISVSALLDVAARECLSRGGPDLNAGEEQERLQRAALQCIGAFAGGKPNRSETVRRAMKQRLRKRHDG